MANHSFSIFTTILLLLLPLSTSATTTDDSLILDVYGNPLEAGTPYYIRTEVSKVGIGGGIVTASRPNQPKCPQFLAQLGVGWYGESPVMFFPRDTSQKHVHASSDLRIVFNNPNSECAQGAWQLTPDSNSGETLVSTGGVIIEDPDSETGTSWFKFERLEFNPMFYRLSYCPSTSNVMCGVVDSVNLFSDDYNLTWLGLTPNGNGLFTNLSFIKA